MPNRNPHPNYSIWNMMKQRCFNQKRECFKDYGGRGITVCDSWKNSFRAFCDDMGNRPSPLHSIDRIDVNGNYEPGNCKWSTIKDQNSNKRNASADKLIYTERFNSLYPVKGETIACVVCGSEFISKSTINKFCSKKHAKKYHQIMANEA